MADIFGRKALDQKEAITADRSEIKFDEIESVSDAIQIGIQYTQQVTRRRSIGGLFSIIYGSQPIGQVTIGRMVTDDAKKIFASKSFMGCAKGKIVFTTKGSCMAAGGGISGPIYTCDGCIVTGYSIQAQAEDLSVIDNITVEFLELTVS